MSFKVLAIGQRNSPKSCLRYVVPKKQKTIVFLIPAEVAKSAGLKVGDLVNFQIGTDKFAGVFAIGKGTRHSRRLGVYNRKAGSLRLEIPWRDPLPRYFPAGTPGYLRFIDADEKGVFSFAVIDSKS